MPRRITTEDEDLLRARGTHPENRATDSRIGDRPKLALLFPGGVEVPIENFAKPAELVRPWSAPKLAPWITPNVPIPLTTDPRSQYDRDATYSAAFRPDFFPIGEAGFRAGQQRAIKLRDDARTLYYAGAWRTAIVIVEFQEGGRRYRVAGINGKFNAQQHNMLDALLIHYRYDLRDKKKPGGPPPVHPDVAITTGEIDGLKGTSVAIGSSISFCEICKPQIAGAGFWLIPDSPVQEALAPTKQSTHYGRHGVH